MASMQVLYLGAASGTSVSHVSDIVGPEGAVYAVEFSHRRSALLLALVFLSCLPLAAGCMHGGWLAGAGGCHRSTVA